MDLMEWLLIGLLLSNILCLVMLQHLCNLQVDAKETLTKVMENQASTIRYNQSALIGNLNNFEENLNLKIDETWRLSEIDTHHLEQANQTLREIQNDTNRKLEEISKKLASSSTSRSLAVLLEHSADREVQIGYRLSDIELHLRHISQDVEALRPEPYAR